ncbi:hypothetical protein JB92DRAFT_1891311 [Gautieria morchelliformis]|nr:hypothetical protein JB92DRAFT_1891311 [Gautieria morchelliformis]
MLDDTLMIKTYQRLFALLLSLGFDEMDMSIREVILEFIAWAPRRLAEIALPLNQSSATCSIPAVITGAIERITSPLEFEEQSKRVKSSLEVLVILAWSGIPGSLYMAEDLSLVAHVSSMLGRESWWDKSTREIGVVFLACLTSLVKGAEIPGHLPAQVCTSVVSHVPSHDLTMAAAIAFYVHAVTKDGSLDPLTLIEVWDHLRDVMFIILGKYQPETLHPLASLTRNTICSALSLILSYIPHNDVGLLINSPWTLTLYNELRIWSQAPFHDEVSPSTRLILGRFIEQVCLNSDHLLHRLAKLLGSLRLLR